MATVARQTAGDDTNEMVKVDELLNFQPNESVEEMYLRLLGLVNLMYDRPTQSEGDGADIDVVREAGSVIVQIVDKLHECHNEQGNEISDLRDELKQKNIELNRLYTDMEQETESTRSRHSAENEGAYSIYPAPLSLPIGNPGLYEETVENIAHDAFQFGQFETQPGSGQDIITITQTGVDDSEAFQQQQQGLGSEIGFDIKPVLDSSETSQQQPESPPYKFQRTLSAESLPKQAFDCTFPSGRGDFLRPGPAYEMIPPLRTRPLLAPGVLLEEGEKVAEWDSVPFSDIEFRDGNLHGDNISGKRTPQTVEKDRDPNSVTVDAERGTTSGPPINVHWPGSPESRSLESISKFSQQRRHAIFMLFGELEESLYTLWRVGWDLGSGQLIAWWHLLLFLTTALYRVTTAMVFLASGTSLSGFGHFPRLPIFTVPRLSWCIIATQGMYLASLMSFLAWKRELELLLLANGLSREYMLNYIYEETRWVVFIGVDKGMFRLGMFEMESLWGIGKDSMKERLIEGLIQ